jgi:hypothetical protein
MCSTSLGAVAVWQYFQNRIKGSPGGELAALLIVTLAFQGLVKTAPTSNQCALPVPIKDMSCFSHASQQ